MELLGIRSKIKLLKQNYFKAHRLYISLKQGTEHVAQHFAHNTVKIHYLGICDGNRDKVVGPLALFLFFLLCVLFTVHPSCTVSFPLSLLLV